MPHASAQLEKSPPAFLAPDLVLEIKIGDIGNFLPDAERRVLTMNPNRYIERAEMAREFEMLILRKMLVRENQYREFGKRILDRAIIGAPICCDRSMSPISAAKFGVIGKTVTVISPSTAYLCD